MRLVSTRETPADLDLWFPPPGVAPTPEAHRAVAWDMVHWRTWTAVRTDARMSGLHLVVEALREGGFDQRLHVFTSHGRIGLTRVEVRCDTTGHRRILVTGAAAFLVEVSCGMDEPLAETRVVPARLDGWFLDQVEALAASVPGG